MLAVSDSAFIRSYKDGMMYSYIICKDNGAIVSNAIGEEATIEDNGLEIEVELKYSRYAICKALTSLVYFPNIYVDYGPMSYNETLINDAKIRKYHNFSVCDILQNEDYSYGGYSSDMYVLLGHVLYPVEYRKVRDYTDSDEWDKFCNITPCINMEIGSIDVTPNRESIIYNDKTINSIKNKIKAAVKEIHDKVSIFSNEDFEDIDKYYESIRSTKYWDPIENTVVKEKYVAYPFTPNVSYKGIKRNDEFNKKVKTLVPISYPCIHYYYDGNILRTHKSLSYNCSKCINNNFIAIQDNGNVTPTIKNYIKDKGITGAIITAMDVQVFKTAIIRSQNTYNVADTNCLDEDLDMILEDLHACVQNHTRVISKKEIAEYSKSRKKVYSSKLESEKCILYYYTHLLGYIETKEAQNYKNVLAMIKDLPNFGRILLIEGNKYNDVRTDQEARRNLNMLQCMGYKICFTSKKAYKGVMTYIKSNPGALSTVVFDYNTLLSNPTPRMERYIANAIMCVRKTPDGILRGSISKDLYFWRDFDKVYKYMYDYMINVDTCFNIAEYYRYYEFKTEEAKYMNKLYVDLAIIADKYMDLECKLGFPIISKYLTAKYAISLGIKLNYKKYNQIKNNPIIKTIYE